MTTSAIANNSTTSKTTATKSQSTLNTESFLKLLSSQMANQNPLNPVSDTEYFAQLAQLGTVQGMEGLQTSMNVTQAQALMGKNVSATVDNNGVSTNISGLVTGMSNQNGTYYLAVQTADGNTTDVKLADVQASKADSSDSMTNLVSLIGQTATGTGTYVNNGTNQQVTASGQIVGVTTVNGQQFARIQTDKYGVINVTMSNLSQIGK